MSIRPLTPKVVVAGVAVCLLAVAPARETSAQAELDCGALLDSAEAAAPAEGASRWGSVEAICEAAHAAWLAARPTLDAATDEALARQSIRWATDEALEAGDCVRALTVLGDVARAFEVLPAALDEGFVRATRAALVCDARVETPPATVPVVGEEPLTFTGFAGGPHDAGRFGMPCVGAVAETPNAVFDVDEARRVSVVATAEETGDLSLVVTGPGGTWCRDDVFGSNPAVAERLTAGQYAVFVGDVGERRTEYRLEVSTQPLAPITVGVAPRYGIVPYPMGAGGEQRVEGVSQGTLEAHLLGPGCTGLIGGQPDFRVQVSSPSRVSVQATPVGMRDLTLAVVGADSVACSDNATDHDPAVSTWLGAGAYDVWVGRKGAAEASYSVRFSEDDLFGVEPGVLTPAFGTGSLSSTRRSVLLVGVASGEEPASGRFGPLCQGFISFEPSHTFYVEEDATVYLEAGPGTSALPGHGGADLETGDLTLVVNGAAGTFCNADYRGRDPGLEQWLPAGTYDVWVGEQELTPAGTSYGLRATLDPPAAGIERPSGRLTLGSAAQPWHGWGRTYGEVAASDVLGDDCAGEIPEVPTLRVTVPEVTGVRVTADGGLLGDLVVALRGPGGSWCTGSDSADAGVEEMLAAGDYEVFVGEAFGTAVGTPYALTVETEPAIVPPMTPMPPTPPAETVELTLDSRFGLAGVPGTSGGPLPARAFGPTCVGHLPEQPQAALNVTEAGLYRLAVVASGDTTMVVDGPGGPWCSDDAEGFNPAVEAVLTPGRYTVSVGSYGPGLRHEFALWVSYQGAGGP